MNSLFFYGTLRHVPLLSVVLGRDPEAQIAQLLGHAVYAVHGEIFPMISALDGGAADGILVQDVSDEEVARLRFYEGGFDYDLSDVFVEVAGQKVKTQVFFPDEGAWTADGPWSLSDWEKDHGAWSVFGAIEEMSYFGTRSRAEVDGMMAMIQARATAKINAGNDTAGHSPGGMTLADVKIAGMTRPYADFYTMEEYDLTFRRYDGKYSDMVRRAVFIATDAVIVLPYDPVRDRVLLVEQFRPGPYARGDTKPWQLEPIAGRIDGSETAEATAHREAKEEAGLTLDALEVISRCYASPGCTTEYYNIFLGLADLPDGIAGINGLAEEAEDIRSYVFSYTELIDLLEQGQIVNAPLMISALWLARHRDRLRAAT